ncbi:hypothetical protein FSARC_7838 [Fusarium sarcochroum]|uniref:Monocarboxylate transporter 4 n=1 Tax=Fusarium sarcochroum TaxID=1208366 RepID=A0A8H4X7U3_9HYPO|nr:hypothetical protein FSARC_7838 [Fusarium sarcochroum]
MASQDRTKFSPVHCASSHSEQHPDIDSILSHAAAESCPWTSSAASLPEPDFMFLQDSYEDTIDPQALHAAAWPGELGELSSAFTHPLPYDTEQNVDVPQVASSGTDDSVNVNKQQETEQTTPKTGKRFSLNSVRVLNKWLTSHTRHPYPSVRDVEAIERQTGLSKQQILNWFANARRRKKFNAPAVSLTPESSDVGPQNIPPRRPSTPFVDQQSPFERWRNSPPEDEPSSITAIAKAISNASGFSSEVPDTTHIRPRHAASSNGSFVTSADNSDSSLSSHASAYSHTSDGSLESLRKVTKKRRRAIRSKNIGRRDLLQACHRFQCTFCTETFKLKHTWQRHEKTLHLSLEQWECSPSGPFHLNQQGEPECVYCGLVNPEHAHFEMHNHDLCHEREREERTFYRKDHMRQHLRLVHGSQFSKSPMEAWRFKVENVKSRCGFCDITMTTWSDRANHLAEHFKEGKTMADWKGTWGFEASTIEMVENAMPPYLIEYERNSPLPFTTQQGAPYSSTSAFELLQLELDYFFSNYVDTNNCTPSDELLHLEACNIIFGAEISYRHPLTTASSWLRDLLMGTEEVVKKAQMTPLKNAARSRFTELRIHSKNDIFEDCKLESSLRQYVDLLQLLNLDIGDEELQREACSIINHMPDASPMFNNLLVGLVCKSTNWLAPFRVRVGLPPGAVNSRSSGSQQELASDGLHLPASTVTQGLSMADLRTQSHGDPDPIISPQHEFRTEISAHGHSLVSLNMYRGLTRELTRFVARTISPLNPTSHVPTDEELQYQARWIMYDSHDVWNQTPADNGDWLSEFKRESGLFK